MRSLHLPIYFLCAVSQDLLQEVSSDWVCQDAKLSSDGQSSGSASTVDGCESTGEKKGATAITWHKSKHYCTVYDLDAQEFADALVEDSGHSACFRGDVQTTTASPSPSPSPPPSPPPSPTPPLPGSWDCQEGWSSSLGSSKDAGKHKKLDDCLAECAKRDGCFAASWHTSAGYCNVNVGDVKHADFLSSSNLEFKSNHMTCYQGAKQSAQVPTPGAHSQVPGEWHRFPYGQKGNLKYPAKDLEGFEDDLDPSDHKPLPDYTFEVQNSLSCPSAYTVKCKGTWPDNSSSTSRALLSKRARVDVGDGPKCPDCCSCKWNAEKTSGTKDKCNICFNMGGLPRAPDLGLLGKPPVPVGTWVPNYPITRRQILERALGWVINGYTYDHTDERGLMGKGGAGAPEGCASDDRKLCPHFDYTSVCQGMVQMAWNGTMHSVQKVDCATEAKPGDWIHVGSHQQLFRRWYKAGETGKDKKWVVYQMGGGWDKANMGTGTYRPCSSGENGYCVHGCYRRTNIIGEEDYSDRPVLTWPLEPVESMVTVSA